MEDLEEVAVKFSKEDIDIDIPMDDQTKDAVRWLISRAFLAGYHYTFVDNSIGDV